MSCDIFNNYTDRAHSSMRTHCSSLFILFWMALATTAGVFSAGDISAQMPLASGDPVHIEADRMVSNQKENAVTFSGNVQAVQGELTINSDEMIVYYTRQAAANPEAQQENQEIKKIFAQGNVEIIQGALLATGNEVEFMADKKQVLLTGNTKVWQNNNLVTGEKVLLDLETETTIIEPGKKDGGRVKAFFYPDSSKQENK